MVEQPKVKMCPSGVPCTSDRCERFDQCLGGDYDAVAALMSQPIIVVKDGCLAFSVEDEWDAIKAPDWPNA